ncbi:metallophosphoesterase 1-like [Ylistrum balloti]|uniref:metallophosphoesterase 1-like n=1 Tax=Ylistrum balloti TaxID=509963 RepID=UPI002905B18E|nr:metallophosphoesterase 1-like [Ylistrum balloti]
MAVRSALITVIWTICQITWRVFFYIRTRRVVRFLFMVLLLVLYCEYFHYFVVLLMCKWPKLPESEGFLYGNDDINKPVKAMVIADTHLLGIRTGNWFDAFRREWQMEISFQTSMLIHRPDVVFILGDLLDDGRWATDAEFKKDVARFKKMFSTPKDTTTRVLVGNHDIGFHHMMKENRNRRFEKAFSSPSVQLFEFHGNLFVLMNSMAMEGDGCKLCAETVNSLEKISQQLKCAEGQTSSDSPPSECEAMEKMAYSPPILLQHFPMYRPSDANCSLPDSAPPDEKEIPFTVNWDCLSEKSSSQVFEWIKPRLILSAHTHHGCYRLHHNAVPEWTVASLSWHNKNNPSFLQVVLSPNDFVVNQCHLPRGTTVIFFYITGTLIALLWLLFPYKSRNTLPVRVWVNKLH